jgi:hypothetical protein
MLNRNYKSFEKFKTGLASWRDAVQRSVTAAQLSMALYTLEQCVAWDKSIMKAVSYIKFHLKSSCNNNINSPLELSILPIGGVGRQVTIM